MQLSKYTQNNNYCNVHLHYNHTRGNIRIKSQQDLYRNAHSHKDYGSLYFKQILL